MNVGIVTTWFERGAAYVSRQYKEILEEENNVFIYARGGEEFAKNDSVWNQGNVTWGKQYKHTTRAKINIKHLKNWITENNIQVVIFNEQHEWEPVIACDEMGVIIGAYIDYYKKETVPFFRIYDFVLCNTKRHYSVFEGFFQSKYIPWGTDTDLFKPEFIKKEHNKDIVTFFHSSGMNPLRKGTDYIIKAAHNLIKEEFKIIIHSQVELTVFFPELKGMIDELIDNEKIEIIDQTISAPGLYHLYDIYLYPSRLEGIGLTVPEAISCGLPTITTDEAPMNEFVQQNLSGRLVDVEKRELRSDNYYWKQSFVSINSLAEEMLFYINNSSHIEKYKEDAREFALSNLDWKKNALDLNRFISELKKQKSGKNQVKESIMKYESNRPLKYYLNTFKPYVNMKKKVKFYFKKS